MTPQPDRKALASAVASRNYVRSRFAEEHRERIDRLWPVKSRFPQATPARVSTIPPPLPPPPNAAAIATLQEVSPLHSGPALHAIMQAACMVTGVSVSDCISVRKDRPLVRARQLYFWLARAVTPLSYPQIGRRCGDRDHSTVMYACAKIARRLSEYADDISAAKKLLGVE